jgi:hypothetical protein
MKIFYPQNVEVKAEAVADRTPTAEQITQAEVLLKAIDRETPFDEVYTMLEAEMPHVFCGSEKKGLVAIDYAELHQSKVQEVEPIIAK